MVIKPKKNDLAIPLEHLQFPDSNEKLKCSAFQLSHSTFFLSPPFNGRLTAIMVLHSSQSSFPSAFPWNMIQCRTGLGRKQKEEVHSKATREYLLQRRAQCYHIENHECNCSTQSYICSRSDQHGATSTNPRSKTKEKDNVCKVDTLLLSWTWLCSEVINSWKFGKIRWCYISIKIVFQLSLQKKKTTQDFALVLLNPFMNCRAQPLAHSPTRKGSSMFLCWKKTEQA